jgi:DNA-binding SARP family transcriptional activator
VARRVEIALLGPLELRVDGRAARVAGRQQRVTLARLALSPGHVVTRSDLIDTLWPSEPPTNAVGNLHSYISRLRRVLGTDRIVREHAGYRLDVDAEDVDVHRVERLAAAAATEGEGGATLLDEALKAWRADALADFDDVEAFAAERARLAELRRSLRHSLFDTRLAAGDIGDVLPHLEAAAAQYPLDEDTHMLLMRALHASGRTVHALRAGRAFRDRLVEVTGLDPGRGFRSSNNRFSTTTLRWRPNTRFPADRPLAHRRPPTELRGRGSPRCCAAGNANSSMSRAS